MSKTVSKVASVAYFAAVCVGTIANRVDETVDFYEKHYKEATESESKLALPWYYTKCFCYGVYQGLRDSALLTISAVPMLVAFAPKETSEEPTE